MAFTQTAHSLIPANAKSLMSVDNTRVKRAITPISRAMVTPAYDPVFTYNGGAFGDETVAETNVLIDDRGVGDYTPRNLNEYKALPGAVANAGTAFAGSAVQPPYPSGQVMDPDYVSSTIVNSPVGWIDPAEPYGPAPVSPTDDPTITSLAPNTTVAGPGLTPVWVVITGTKFTPYSQVETGNVITPYHQFHSATKMSVLMDPARSSAGVVVVKVIDHGVKSAGSNFTFT